MASKHILTFIANGTHTDGKGEKWARTSSDDGEILAEREYSDEDYQKRGDLKFMVKYGSMKHREISLEAPKAPVEDTKAGTTGVQLTPAK